ncbi:uncharacterized protein LOC141913853 [Tubulanus polymorphus]|uniref:uncharacterized protein LOC141913853 n=1 Tax=Tubulanus polymorphus TaxID=672921 RepID=UPI003DA5E317
MATKVLLFLASFLVVFFGSTRVKATTCYGSSCNNSKWAKHCKPGQAPVTQTPGVELKCPVDAECDAGWNGPGCQIGNVARDKQATSSSVLPYGALYGADKCVDGLISDGEEEELCHTKNETDAWFQVDLGAQHVVLGVDLYDRSDATNCDNNPDNSWKRRSRNLEVRVGNTTASTDAGVPRSNVKCGYHGPALCGGHVFKRCSKPLIGRYVTVQHQGIGKVEYFGLAEVKVHGYVYTAKSDCSKPASFGCMLECRCDGNAICDYLSGTCSTGCLPNYIGHSCEQEPTKGPTRLKLESTRLQDDSRPLSQYTKAKAEISWHGLTADELRCKADSAWYQVEYKNKHEEMWTKLNAGTGITSATITGLTPYTRYIMRVGVKNKSGVTYKYSDEIEITTATGEPGPPDAVSASDITESGAELTWKPPKSPNGKISGYKLACKPVQTLPGKALARAVGKPIEFELKETRKELTELESFTQYACNVTAKTGKGYGNSAQWKFWTSGQLDISPPEVVRVTNSTIDIKLTPVTKGNVSAYHFVVEKQDVPIGGRKKRAAAIRGERRYENYEEARRLGLKAYLAAVVVELPITAFTIGDGKNYSGFYNAPLQKETPYVVILGVETTVDGNVDVTYTRMQGDPIYPRNDQSSVVLLVVIAAVLLVVLCAVAVFLLVRYEQRLVRLTKRSNETDGQSAPMQNIQGRQPTAPAATSGGQPIYQNVITAPVPAVAEVAGAPAVAKASTSAAATTSARAAAKATTSGEEAEDDLYETVVLSGVSVQDLLKHTLHKLDDNMKILKNEFESVPKWKKGASEVASNKENMKKNRYRNIVPSAPVAAVTRATGAPAVAIASTSVAAATAAAAARATTSGAEAEDDLYETVVLSGVSVQDLPKHTLHKLDDHMKILENEFESVPKLKEGASEVASNKENMKKNRYRNIVPSAPVATVARATGAPAVAIASTSVAAATAAAAAARATTSGAEAEDDLYETVVWSGVSVHDLLKHTLHKLDDNMKILKNEFESVPKLKEGASEVASNKENMKKNRYRNIVPYDASRVVLEVEPGADPYSDYINANYIQGFVLGDRHIACQAPLESTIEDQWRMVWQLKCPCIVILTELTEVNKGGKVKCTPYWPTEAPKTYGNLTVSIRKETKIYSDPVVYCHYLTISKPKCDSHDLVIFQYKGWPDHGVPFPASEVVILQQFIKERMAGIPGPVVVHCSSGCGWTGSYLAAEYLMNEIARCGKASIFSIYKQMRDSRPEMIQNLKQYLLVHQILLEQLVLGVSRHPVAGFEQSYRRLLDSTDIVSSRSLAIYDKIEEQFLVYKASTVVQSNESVAYAKSANIVTKSRHPDIIPEKQHLVPLPSMDKFAADPVKNPTFVNATFIHTSTRDNMFIATQTPLPSTVNEFWCTVFDHGCEILVMMHQDDQNDRTYCDYWPNDAPTTYGLFTVTPRGGAIVVPNSTVVSREFEVEKKGGAARYVCQFQFTEWDANQLLPSKETLFSLVDIVTNERKTSPILVHCMDGATRTGLFCGAYDLVSRAASDDTIDIYNELQYMRRTRAQFIPNCAQFRILHEILVLYFRDFDIYANFR